MINVTVVKMVIMMWMVMILIYQFFGPLLITSSDIFLLLMAESEGFNFGAMGKRLPKICHNSI